MSDNMEINKIPEEITKDICDQVRERAKKSAEELSDREIVESILIGLQKATEQNVQRRV